MKILIALEIICSQQIINTLFTLEHNSLLPHLQHENLIYQIIELTPQLSN